MKRRHAIIAAAIALAGAVILGLVWYAGRSEQRSEEQGTGNSIPPSLTLTDTAPEQGDTLIVSAGDAGLAGLPVAFGRATTSFFRTPQGAVAVFGIDAGAAAGTSSITVAGPAAELEVRIRPRSFPRTELVVPPDLVRKGVGGAELARRIASRDQPSLEAVLNVVTPRALFEEPFAEPLSRWNDVGGFGVVRTLPSGGIRHLGVDLEGNVGDPVRAANSGIVRLARALPNYGNTVAIDHGLGIFTAYLHLSEITVADGEGVGRGDIIGRVGASGEYTLAPHLHFSVKIRGASVDPRRFLDTMNRFLR